MSATDAFILAHLNQVSRNLSGLTESPRQSENNQLADQYAQLVADWNDLVTRFNAEKKACDAAFRQIDALMAFINASRLAQGQPALLMSQIQFAVDYDLQLKTLKQEMWDCGVKSKIGVISKSEQYWDNINEKVFKPFSEGMTQPEKVPYGHPFMGASRADLGNSLYAEMSGWKETQQLKDEVAALKRQVAELQQQLAGR